MNNLQRIQARARELARSGMFVGWRPVAFELRFEKGYEEAREWLHNPAVRDELIDNVMSLGLQRTQPHTDSRLTFNSRLTFS